METGRGKGRDDYCTQVTGLREEMFRLRESAAKMETRNTTGLRVKGVVHFSLVFGWLLVCVALKISVLVDFGGRGMLRCLDGRAGDPRESEI